ncbi:hypothetical protein AR457_18445 [Streptomyces agglomeratus]|uniref:Uncharacterized protein n=1 Tax=Streptomyces agglomeratus TaxID=285458 RepID=A0A1E5P9E1_9ACTN|nr:hypothetical protein [Streptomyces agglomeratus]OEJ26162.1 hypothetical protein AS594_18305 [Streptomyces agglomeratus]OEJ39797.1 hypothetical protein BGK70_18210 [Streptomyces agglomeratus]OEJ45823.1 hypothetical protein AR457_18445 [Streptomyces agglomeratus]OEJ52345.1 hypothetical protein BGK72_17800 [Streptomyces agglomeratus]OEJ59719.1 hypothetical protein BGM19_18740 [Streptomyces agglomeratus]
MPQPASPPPSNPSRAGGRTALAAAFLVIATSLALIALDGTARVAVTAVLVAGLLVCAGVFGAQLRSARR